MDRNRLGYDTFLDFSTSTACAQEATLWPGSWDISVNCWALASICGVVSLGFLRISLILLAYMDLGPRDPRQPGKRQGQQPQEPKYRYLRYHMMSLITYLSEDVLVLSLVSFSSIPSGCDVCLAPWIGVANKFSAQNRHTSFPSQTGGLPPASEVQTLWAGAAAVNCCLVLLCFLSRNDTRYCSITVAVYILK